MMQTEGRYVVACKMAGGLAVDAMHMDFDSVWQVRAKETHRSTGVGAPRFTVQASGMASGC
jgi:hypothetical protein